MFDFSKNHFELFGLPVGFMVDNEALAARYRDLQKVVHPDRYANATDQERRISLQQATRVNEALATLKDPLKRAIYLLSLHGIDAQAKNGAATDPEFLMEQMALREALAEAGDRPDPYAELDDLMRRITGMIKTVTAQLAVQFEDASPEQLAAAQASVHKLQFLHKLHAEAEAVEARLEELH
jgi:molecular chaperone HscB